MPGKNHILELSDQESSRGNIILTHLDSDIVSANSSQSSWQTKIETSALGRFCSEDVFTQRTSVDSRRFHGADVFTARTFIAGGRL